MSENKGLLGQANQEIRAAIDDFAAEQRAGRRLPSLLRRTDAMLTELETLNLLNVMSTPASWRFELTGLVADLPFEYEPRIGHRLSPTKAIDLVFDIQAGLFRLMTGTEPEDERFEVAS
jgi:hypothetical protein